MQAPSVPSLGLLVRLFTASNGHVDHTDPSQPSDQPRWLQTVVAHEHFEASLDLAAEIGATGIEIVQAGQLSGAEYLLAQPSARAELQAALAQRGLEIAALNCSGMPLHPVRGPHYQEVIRQTIRLAQLLGVTTIVSMSGAGGDGPESTAVNWVFFPWPEESVALLERQWEQAIALWQDLAGFARDHGVERIGLELHPMNLVYNVPTLLRLREAVGPIIGATLDPSHLQWQQMDPIAVVHALGPAVHHVHLKDTQLIPDQMATAGVLDQRPFSDPGRRAWIQRAIGRGHDATFWSDFVDALAASGYQGSVSIENEDPVLSHEDGVREAAALLRPMLGA